MHKDHPIVVLISAEQEWRPVQEHYHPAILEITPYGECFEVKASPISRSFSCTAGGED